MGRQWKPVVGRMVGDGSIHGGFEDHAILVFWCVIVTFSIFTTLIFSCADGASKRDSHPPNNAAACGGGCGGGCGG
ncbi:hypothetical protein HanIR_Chr08g0349791 [Helianthus annuus]|nr:hypothetical protein HanIR_Chr08g0349791 [Helianthus annuus]